LQLNLRFTFYRSDGEYSGSLRGTDLSLSTW